MANVYSLEGKVVGRVDLPAHFSEPLRADLIARAVVTTWSRSTQPYAPEPGAGMKSSARFCGRRRKYGHSYGWGISRVPRMMVRGGRRVGTARIVPNTVGGKRAFPPLLAKEPARINAKERRKAIRSAIAATGRRELVEGRGHRVEGLKELPLVVEDAIEQVSGTKALIEALGRLGLVDELERGAVRKVRAGRGTTRGRRHKGRKSALIVVSEDKGIRRSAANVPGVDVALVGRLSAAVLAPGTHPGRVTVWSKGAIEALGAGDLYRYR